MEKERAVYLITEKNGQAKWRIAGNAFVCKDGSTNLRLDLFPGLTFNIRPIRSNLEARELSSGSVFGKMPEEVQ